MTGVFAATRSGPHTRRHLALIVPRSRSVPSGFRNLISRGSTSRRPNPRSARSSRTVCGTTSAAGGDTRTRTSSSLGLVQVEYLGIEALAADQEEFESAHPLLKHATPEVRASLYRELLDHLRKWMAIKSQVLDLAVSSRSLRDPTVVSVPPRGVPKATKNRRGSRWMMVTAPKRKESSLRDMDLIVRGGSRSSLGKTLAGESTLERRRSGPKPEVHRVRQAYRRPAPCGCSARSSVRENTPFDQPGWRLNDAAVLFRLGEPKPSARCSSENSFFRGLYENLAAMLNAEAHPLFGFEARERTAQVDGERRAIREKRFRFGEKERKELTAEDERLREIGEANRFFQCSSAPRQWS